jgi:hypothetical protein
MSACGAEPEQTDDECGFHDALVRLVGVESLAALTAKVAGSNHLPEQWAWTVL